MRASPRCRAPPFAVENDEHTRERVGRGESQLISLPDRSVQYRTIQFTERLAEPEAVASPCS